MKELKFRAWDEKKKRMIFPTSIGWRGGKTSICFDHNAPHEDITEERPEGMVVGITESGFPLMQFTGLHDKNGKEIYDGDVVQLYDQAQGHKNGRDVVELEPFLIMKYQRSLESRSVEVIGNIYENPNLLA